MRCNGNDPHKAGSSGRGWRVADVAKVVSDVSAQPAVFEQVPEVFVNNSLSGSGENQQTVRRSVGCFY